MRLLTHAARGTQPEAAFASYTRAAHGSGSKVSSLQWHVHVKRIPIGDVPAEPAELSQWCALR